MADPGIKYGYKSGLEGKVAKQFEDRGLDPCYEQDIIYYKKPISKYHPDFKLPNGIFVETKGRFMPADRHKHLLIQQQHPNIEIRFVFTNPNQKLSKTSKTTYAEWCDAHGFTYAVGEIPDEWFK